MRTALAAVVITLALASPTYAVNLPVDPLHLNTKAAAAASTLDPLSMFIGDIADAIKNGSANIVTDLTAADADAKAHSDTIADNCYTAEIAFLGGIPSLQTPSSSMGPIQIFQLKRDLVNAFKGGVPQGLTIGCGPLFLDEQTVMLKLAAKLSPLGIVIPTP